MITRRRWCAMALAVSALGVSALRVGDPAAAAPGKATVSRQHVHDIVRMTGYQGLRSHHFGVASTFRAAGAKTFVVRLDHAPLGVPLRTLRADLALGSRLAAARPRFTIPIRTGSGATRRFTYAVAPTGVLAPHQPYVRYLIFTRHSQSIAGLTRPQPVPAIQALTVIDPASRMNVSLLQDTASGDRWGPSLPAGQLFAMVESLNTTSYVYLTPQSIERLPKHHPSLNTLVALGREVWANSLGFAIVSAQQGTSYRTYRHQVSRLHFNIHQRHQLRYLEVSAKQYRRLA